MLPFNKRRNNSEIEIGTDEMEPVQLPPVRTPSVRPAAGAAPSYRPPPVSSRALPPPSVRPSAPPARPSRPPISFRPTDDDNERTLFVADKAPRRTLELRQPPVPKFDEPSVLVSNSRESFSDDEATRIHPNSSRSVLSMSSPSARQFLDESSGRIASPLPPAPLPAPLASAARMEEPRSSAAVDMSMTVGAGASQSQQVTSRSKVTGGGRPTAVWTAALVAVGVFTGLAAALVARGGGDSMVTASAALVDPAQGNVTSQIAAPQQNTAVAQVAPVQAAAPVQNTQGAQVAAVSQALQPAASCAADVTPTTKAADTKVAAPPPVVAETKVADVKPPVAVAAPPPVVKPVAPPPVAKPIVASNPQPKPVIASVPKPAAPPAAKPTAKGSDMDSASAADALAKAQLEASLGR